MDFKMALVQLLDGVPMRRNHWPAGDHLLVQRPDDLSKMTQPYIYLNTDEGIRFPYTFTQSDIFGQDWEDTISALDMTDPFN